MHSYEKENKTKQNKICWIGLGSQQPLLISSPTVNRNGGSQSSSY